jgi:hypothetical protein
MQNMGPGTVVNTKIVLFMLASVSLLLGTHSLALAVDTNINNSKKVMKNSIPKDLTENYGSN